MNKAIRFSFITIIQFLLLTTTFYAHSKDNSVVHFGDYTINANESVSDIVVLFGDLTIEGTVEEDVVVIFGDLDIKQSGKVNSDAVIVGGDLKLVSLNQIAGKQVQVGLTGKREGDLFEGIFKIAFFGALIKFFGILASKLFFLITTILLAFIFANPLMLIGETVQKAPWKCGLIGFLVWLCFPAAIVMLIITIFGIFLLPLLIPVVFLVVIFSFAAMAALIGKQIKLKSASPIAQIALGALIIFLLSLIPFAYYFVFLVTVLMGTGAILFSKFGTSAPKFLK